MKGRIGGAQGTGMILWLAGRCGMIYVVIRVFLVWMMVEWGVRGSSEIMSDVMMWNKKNFCKKWRQLLSKFPKQWFVL
jgi:hypothetical protein